MKIVRNFDGTDPGEFIQNLQTYRTAFVSGDGDMTTLDSNMDSTASEAHLTRLRKDIYESGSAVDTQEKDLGNASGVALRFRYADLSTDCDDLATEFRFALSELMWFIKADMLNRGYGDFSALEVKYVFNTDNILNEAETITNAKNSVGIISDETIIANHP